MPTTGARTKSSAWRVLCFKGFMDDYSIRGTALGRLLKVWQMTNCLKLSYKTFPCHAPLTMHTILHTELAPCMPLPVAFNRKDHQKVKYNVSTDCFRLVTLVGRMPNKSWLGNDLWQSPRRGINSGEEEKIEGFSRTLYFLSVDSLLHSLASKKSKPG